MKNAKAHLHKNEIRMKRNKTKETLAKRKCTQLKIKSNSNPFNTSPTMTPKCQANYMIVIAT